MVVIACAEQFTIGLRLCGFVLVERQGLSNGIYDEVHDLRVRGCPMHIDTARTLAQRDSREARRPALIFLQEVFASQALHSFMHLHHRA